MSEKLNETHVESVNKEEINKSIDETVKSLAWKITPEQINKVETLKKENPILANEYLNVVSELHTNKDLSENNKNSINNILATWEINSINIKEANSIINTVRVVYDKLGIHKFSTFESRFTPENIKALNSKELNSFYENSVSSIKDIADIDPYKANIEVDYFKSFVNNVANNYSKIQKLLPNFINEINSKEKLSYKNLNDNLNEKLDKLS